MTHKQPIFREEYCTKLSNELNTGVSVELYASQEPAFDFSEKDLCYLNDFEVKRGNFDKMNEGNKSNLECAILLYEALPDLTPMIAAYDPFWLYLSHKELFTYIRNRWPNVLKDENGNDKDIQKTKDYIMDYWFPGDGNAVRSSLPGLWWSVYLTVDENRQDKYELTRVLFKQEDLRTRTFGTYTLFRHKPAAVATLSFIKSRLETTFKHSFQNKCRYMTKYLNYLGGCRLLSYMDEDFFTQMLNKKVSDIEKIS